MVAMICTGTEFGFVVNFDSRNALDLRCGASPRSTKSDDVDLDERWRGVICINRKAAVGSAVDFE